MYSIRINLSGPKFTRSAVAEVTVDLSVESRKLARELKQVLQSGDEATEVRLTKAFVRSLTPEQRKELLQLIEAIKEAE